MRVAIVTETWLPTVDGVVTRLRHTVDALTGAGHDVLVVAPTTGSGTRARQLELPGLAVPFVDRQRRVGLPWSRPLVEAIGRFGPDVVHVVNPVLMGWVALRAIAARYPTVASFHTDIEAYAGRYHLGWCRPAIRAMMRDTYGRADRTLATSPTGQQRLAALGLAPTLWPPAVDAAVFGPGPRRSAPDWFGGPDPDRRILLCVGRLAPEKNVDLLPRMLATAAAQGRRWHLVLVGDGPERPRMEQRCAGLPISFAGSRPANEVAEAYRSADLVIMPSLTETVGLVILEAAACGARIVAADTPATRHTADDRPGTTLVASAASAADWVAAVDHSLRQPRPEPARIATWPEVTAALIEAYRSASVRRLPDRPRPADSPTRARSATSADRTARRSFAADS